MVMTRTYIYSRYINSVSCVSCYEQGGDGSLPVPFNHIYQVIRGAVRFPYCDIRVAELVLAEHGFDFIVINICEGHSICNCDATLVFLANYDRRRLFVESDTKSF